MSSNYKEIRDYPSILNVGDVAEILKISKPKAYELFRYEGFPALLCLGRVKRVRRDDFLSWLETHINR